MRRLILRVFQCEMELDDITVSRLLLVPRAGLRGGNGGNCPVPPL